MRQPQYQYMNVGVLGTRVTHDERDEDGPTSRPSFSPILEQEQFDLGHDKIIEGTKARRY